MAKNAKSSNENPDPYLQLLSEWEENKRMAEHYAALEKDQRALLFAGAFPNPVEGTQRHQLPDGRVIVGQHKVNRRIDEAALTVTLQALREQGVANADQLVKYKPELAKREWNSLSPDMKLIFSTAVIATPGSPTIEVQAAKVLKA